MLDVLAFAAQCGVTLPVMRRPGAASAGAPGLPAGAGPDSPDDGPPTPDAAALLAEKMTEYAITRCEHGAVNRCRMCGIERARDFTPGSAGGAPAWRVAWRPIAGAVPAPPRALPAAGTVEGSE
jgi:hypothetical protein